jgi:hypothetical protein
MKMKKLLEIKIDKKKIEDNMRDSIEKKLKETKK